MEVSAGCAALGFAQITSHYQPSCTLPAVVPKETGRGRDALAPSGAPQPSAGTHCQRHRRHLRSAAFRVVPIQRAGRIASHKLTTYLSSSISSCSGPSGSSRVCGGTGSVLVVPGDRRRSDKGVYWQSIDICADVYSALLVLMAIYFILSY